MEMSNPGYRAWHAQQLEATVAEYGFDGAMDDSMGPAPLGKNYASGIPIDPATGQAYTATEYLANSVLLLGRRQGGPRWQVPRLQRADQRSDLQP